MSTPEQHHFIPGPTLARPELERRLRALGYRRTHDVPRTHLDSRGTGWEHPNGSQLGYWENHLVGERFLIAAGKLPDGLGAAIEHVHRLVLLQQIESAPGLPEAMAPLRRLCLLEQREPSAELRAWLDRAFASPDLFVRHAAATAAMTLGRDPALEILAARAASEPHPGLRSVYRRALKANRPGARASGRKTPAKSTGRAKTSKKATKAGQAAPKAAAKKAPTRKAATTTRAPTRKAATAKKAAPKRATAKKAAPTKRATTKVAPAKRATSAKKAASSKKAAPAKAMRAKKPVVAATKATRPTKKATGPARRASVRPAKKTARR